MIILIVGDFGVGKDTFADMLVDCFGDEAHKILSYTTRKQRYDGEDTHIFVSHDFWNAVQEEIPSPIVAETKIDGEFYGTLRHQFCGSLPYEDISYDIYVVDDIGVRDVIQSHIDSVFVIEIVRPKWLIKVPKERLNRQRTDSYDYKCDFRVINDGSLEKLKTNANEVYHWIVTHIE